MHIRTLLGAGALALALAAAPASVHAADPADPLEQTVNENEKVVTGQVEIGAGHVDLGPKIVDGQWRLVARDNTVAGQPKWRDLDDVIFRVHDKGAQTLPNKGFEFTGATGGQEVYAVPQTEVPGVLWLGWNTQDPAVIRTVARGVTLTFADAHQLGGDGKLTLFLQPGNFAPPQVLYHGGKAEDIFVDPNTHTHTNWVFTKPGIYQVTVSARADGKTTYDATTTLTFAVGDDASIAEARAAQAKTAVAPSSATTQSSAASASGTSSTSPATSTGTASSTPAATASEKSSVVPIAVGVGVGVVVVGGGIMMIATGRRKKSAESEVFGDE